MLVSPVGGQRTSGPLLQSHHTRFKVWKTYLGPSSEYIKLDTSAGTSCAAIIPSTQTSLIIAKSKPSARSELTYRPSVHLMTEKTDFYTNYCLANLFSRQQLLNYLENGIDVPSRELCFVQIKQAYDNSISDFHLEDEECEQYVQPYNSTFRVKPK